MTIILNIETSTKNCSISLSINGTILLTIEQFTENYSHAEKIHCFISYAIEANLLKLSEVNAICVNKGPGSFTGLKIGLAIAKGLCYGLNKPLVVTDTLSILIERIRLKKGIIISIIDVLAQELYISVYNENKIRVTSIHETILKKNIIKNFTQKKIYLLEYGTRKTKNYTKIPISYLSEMSPSSQEMAFLSYKYYQNKKFEILSKFEPFYCKNNKII